MSDIDNLHEFLPEEPEVSAESAVDAHRGAIRRVLSRITLKSTIDNRPPTVSNGLTPGL